MEWSAIQAFMKSSRIHGWLIHDFRGSSSVLARLLPASAGGESEKRWTTRRVDFFIPAEGTPVVLSHNIDALNFARPERWGQVRHETYMSWQQMHEWLRHRVSGKRIAMEYSAGGALPVVSSVDGGTIDLIRGLGAEVVSSADLIQTAVSRWSAPALAEHLAISKLVDATKDAAFALIASSTRAGRTIYEHEVAQFIRDRFVADGLEYLDGPIVAVNAHAADPHFEPSEKHPTVIKNNDWVLIDLWARRPGEDNLFSDVTWTGFVGATVPDLHRRVFETVRQARDASLALAQREWAAGRAVQGWQLDDAARETIISAGFERGLRHRTGHSLSPGLLVHGSGMNLDNLETHDTRTMLAGTGFTIEPGIYLPGEHLGVRNEINVYVDESRGPIVTSGKQDAIILCG